MDKLKYYLHMRINWIELLQSSDLFIKNNKNYDINGFFLFVILTVESCGFYFQFFIISLDFLNTF